MKLLQKPIIKLPKDLREAQINERVEWVRCVLGLSVPSFAISFGVVTERMERYLRGDLDITINLVKKMEQIYGVNRRWTLSGHGITGLTAEKINDFLKEDPHTDEELSKRILEVRTEADMTQAVFAGHLGVTRDVVVNVELGRVLPTVKFVKKLIKKFGLQADWVLFGTGPKRKSGSQELGKLVAKGIKLNV